MSYRDSTDFTLHFPQATNIRPARRGYCAGPCGEGNTLHALLSDKNKVAEIA